MYVTATSLGAFRVPGDSEVQCGRYESAKGRDSIHTTTQHNGILSDRVQLQAAVRNRNIALLLSVTTP